MKKAYGALLAVLLVGIVSVGLVSAFGGGRMMNFPQKGHMMEMHESMEPVMDAVEAGDYTAWKEAITNTDHGKFFGDEMTEAQFEVMVKMHDAKMDEDYETANTLAKELGFNEGHARMHGMGGCPFVQE